MRASEKEDTINANCGSQNFDLVTYDEALTAVSTTAVAVLLLESL